MKNMTIVLPMAALAASVLHASQGIWIGEAGTTPQTAADYTVSANWHDGYVPGQYDDVFFTNAYTTTRYVKLPSSLSVGRIYSAYGSSASYNTTLVGGTLTMMSSATGAGTFSFTGKDGLVTRVFADVEAPNGLASTYVSYCGDIKTGAGKDFTFSGGYAYVRFDAYANSSDPVRTGVFDVGTVQFGNCERRFSAPAALEAPAEGVWTLTSGSPYMTRVSGLAATAVPAGCPVYGTGIATGAFVKRIFSNDLVEMSAAATEEAVGNTTVTFAAFTPQVYASFGAINIQANRPLYLSKRSVGTVFRFEPRKITSGTYPLVVAVESGMQPGTFVTHDTSAYSAYVSVSANAHFEFGETSIGTPGFAKAKHFAVNGYTVTVTATNGIAAEVSVFTNVTGALVKDGAGSVSAAVALDNPGRIEVKEGVFEAREYAEGSSIATLAISNGAVFRVAGGTFRVAKLYAEPGAVIEGPGVVEFTGSRPDLSSVTLAGNVQAKIKGVEDAPVLSVPEGSVAGNPAFWVDASDADSLTLDGTDVLKWKDVRGDGHLFATNIIRRPTLVEDAAGRKYVKFAHFSVSPHWITNEQALVWSDVVPRIKAIFAVLDPADGGGFLLGRSSRIPDSVAGAGGFFYRPNDYWFQKIMGNIGAYPDLRMYLDGDAVDPAAACFRGPNIQLVECHFADTDGDISADAFGTGYKDGGTEYAANGGIRAYEYIIYTNTLTMAERIQTAQYLMRKWKKRDVALEMANSNADIGTLSTDATGGGLSIADSETVTLDSLESGTLLKTGGGSLFLKSASGGSLHAAGGETVIRSLPLTRDALPVEGRWLHFDAADASTLETNVTDGVAYLVKWYDCGGSGYTLRKSAGNTKKTSENGWVHDNVVQGLPMVDMGEPYQASGGWAMPEHNRSLGIFNANGAGYSAGNYNGSSAPALKGVFIAYDSSQGGNALLSSRGNSNPLYGFPPAYDTSNPALATYIWGSAGSDTAEFGLSKLSQYFSNASGRYCLPIRHNAEYFNPFSTRFSGGQDVFVYSTDIFARQTSGLGSQGYDQHVGGIMYGEVILYTNYIGEANTRLVEAYLMKKWKGIDTPGYGAAAVDSLTVDEGATVTVTGTGPLTVKTLNAAGGTVSGAVALASGAEIVVPVNGDGTLGCVEMGPLFDYSAGAAVRIDGNLRNAVPGVYRVVTSSAIAAEDAARFTFVNADAQKKYTVGMGVEDGAVVVKIAYRGTMMTIR